jgi:hypothetical protein
MKLKVIRAIKILAVLFFLLIISAIAIYPTHPIILKWLTGEAKIIGKPINATVYTDGHINRDIIVYREKTCWGGQKTNSYILKLKQFDKYGMLKFINIYLTDKWIGRPVGTSISDYDTIDGYLFQSETGSICSDFRDDMKGFNFDPHLQFTDIEIKFNVPLLYLKFNSVRIELNESTLKTAN